MKVPKPLFKVNGIYTGDTDPVFMWYSIDTKSSTVTHPCPFWLDSLLESSGEWGAFCVALCELLQ